MKLYNFWRSGTSHRLRIALNLKGLPVEYLAVHLGKEEHLKDAFKAINPQQLVPALVLDGAESLLLQLVKSKFFGDAEVIHKYKFSCSL